eukprot:759727-Hanusia_phi.AAC.1
MYGGKEELSIACGDAASDFAIVRPHALVRLFGEQAGMRRMRAMKLREVQLLPLPPSVPEFSPPQLMTPSLECYRTPRQETKSARKGKFVAMQTAEVACGVGGNQLIKRRAIKKYARKMQQNEQKHSSQPKMKRLIVEATKLDCHNPEKSVEAAIGVCSVVKSKISISRIKVRPSDSANYFASSKDFQQNSNEKTRKQKPSSYLAVYHARNLSAQSGTSIGMDRHDSVLQRDEEEEYPESRYDFEEIDHIQDETLPAVMKCELLFILFNMKGFWVQLFRKAIFASEINTASTSSTFKKFSNCAWIPWTDVFEGINFLPKRSKGSGNFLQEKNKVQKTLTTFRSVQVDNANCEPNNQDSGSAREDSLPNSTTQIKMKRAVRFFIMLLSNVLFEQAVLTITTFVPIARSRTTSNQSNRTQGALILNCISPPNSCRSLPSKPLALQASKRMYQSSIQEQSNSNNSLSDCKTFSSHGFPSESFGLFQNLENLGCSLTSQNVSLSMERFIFPAEVKVDTIENPYSPESMLYGIVTAMVVVVSRCICAHI